MNAGLKAAALSYLRAALSSAAALLISGITDPKILFNTRNGNKNSLFRKGSAAINRICEGF